MTQTVTLTLPDAIYYKLNRAAQLTHRTIDDIVAASVDTALTSDVDLRRRWRSN